MAHVWCLYILPLAALVSLSTAAAIDIPGNNGVAAEAGGGILMATPADFLQAHNGARAAVRVPPLAWNRTLEDKATWYANKLRVPCELRLLKASSTRNKNYGQNLYKGSGYRSADEVVSFWVEGRRWYDHDTNACAAGKICGTYTQVVWRDTLQLGCASRACRNGPNGIDIGVAVCKYFPPGNYPGKLPY